MNSMMLMPCGPSAVPTGGAGVALPAGSWRVRTMRTFLATSRGSFLAGRGPVSADRARPGQGGGEHTSERTSVRERVRAAPPTKRPQPGPSGRCSQFFDLEEVQLDRRLAAEDAHQDLDLVPFGVDFVDRPDELGERPVRDADALALRERHAVLGRLHAHVPEDLLDLGLVERDGLAADARDVRAADEARDARGVADDEPAVGIEDHLDEDVAGVDLLLDRVALALADLDLVLHGHEDLEDPVLHPHGFDPMLQVRLDLVLVARVRVDHVPALVRAPGLDLAQRHVHANTPVEEADDALEEAVPEEDVQADREADREYEHGQVAGLLDRRPGDLLQLGDRFGDEAADTGHDVSSLASVTTLVSPRAEAAALEAIRPRIVAGAMDSNLQPPVLETGALPIELHPCGSPGRYLASRWRV